MNAKIRVAIVVGTGCDLISRLAYVETLQGLNNIELVNIGNSTEPTLFRSNTPEPPKYISAKDYLTLALPDAVVSEIRYQKRSHRHDNSSFITGKKSYKNKRR